MGIFGTSSPFDEMVEKATSETSTREDWAQVLEVCDAVAAGGAAAARGCVRACARRLAHPDPHVALQAATLLDAAVANCGRPLLLEVASREFEAEFRRVLSRAQPPLARRLRALLRKWAAGEFRDDPQLDLIPALHARLERADPAPPDAAAPAPAAAAAASREQEDLARAIELSLKEAPPAAAAAPLYPPAPVEARPVRALYDFEAAEDNELTFSAGEIVHVTDSSDPNWWKGYNARGEGLFPANFVTAQLNDPAAPAAAAAAAAAPAAPAAAPDTDADEEAGAVISEATLDECLARLGEADPAAAGGAGEAALASLERRAGGVAALADAALQRADRRHARLTQLSAELVDALNLYRHLMSQPPPALPPLAGMPGAPR